MTEEHAAVRERFEAAEIPDVALAWIAADHLGDESVFTALIETGGWTGIIDEDGVSVALRLRLSALYGRPSGTALDISASPGAAAPEPAGDAAAAATELAVAHLAARLAHQVDFAAPVVRTRSISVPPLPLPRLFYGASGVADAVSRAGGWTGRRQGQRRLIVRAPEGGVRVELGVAAADGPREEPLATVSVGIERVGGDVDEAEAGRWREAAAGIRAALEAAAATEPVAPSFSIGAPVDAVAGALRSGFRDLFPEGAVTSVGGGWYIGGMELGEAVWANVTMSIVAAGEWETRVTFTGMLYGAGLSRDPGERAAARSAFRDAVARGAAELHADIAAHIAQIPPRHPGTGLG